MSRRAYDLAGRVFGRLTAIERGPSVSHRRTTWSCTCECGKTTVVLTQSLLRGNTRSCGCLQREVASATRAELRRREDRMATHHRPDAASHRRAVATRYSFDDVVRQVQRDWPDGLRRTLEEARRQYGDD